MDFFFKEDRVLEEGETVTEMSVRYTGALSYPIDLDIRKTSTYPGQGFYSTLLTT